MGRKEKKYHYIYKITCLKNNRYYIGMHSTDNLEDGYMGGGKRIKNSVKKHGKDAHRKEILGFFESRNLLRQREIELVNEELLNDPMCMNLQPGGGGGFINEEHIKKFRKASSEWSKEKWKTEGFFDKNREVNSLRMKKMHENKVIKYDTFSGKKHSNETKEKIGSKNSISQKGEKNSQFGTIWINRDNLDKKISSKEKSKYLAEGWNLGRKKR
jgi:hypothetical protein